MGYNRSLDLMAIATAAVKAGLPDKAASYLQAAAKDPSADSAIAAVFAANAKKKPAKKKKSKASFTSEQLVLRAAFNVSAAEGDDEDEDMPEDEDKVEEAESDEDMMKVEEDDSVAALRAALVAGNEEVTTDEMEDMTRDEETASDEETDKFLPVAASKKATTVKAANERFSRTLRNLAARSK